MENLDPSQLAWLLEGDVSIQYQVQRDLLGVEKPDLQKRIATEGWGAKFLHQQKEAGHWGHGFYQPKWTSTHYTLLDLKNLQISPEVARIKFSINHVLQNHKGPDGGILPIGTKQLSDGCINGMFLNYACYFLSNEDDLRSIVDCILREQLADGGFNCRSNRGGASHSSVHTTISILEGILEYMNCGYSYRRDELQNSANTAREFLLQHRLYKSDKTGEVIKPQFTMLSYPSRWKYDILRALDYFQMANIDYDSRMKEALELLIQKRRLDKNWPVQAKHAGQTHFEMEKTGSASRWNTLRALRVLRHFNIGE